MYTFATPEPVALRVKTQAGSVRVTADGRAETTVEVQPSNPSNDADVEHAANTVVEQRGREIVIRAPEVRRFDPFAVVTRGFGRTPSIEITVVVPAGSDVAASSASAEVLVRGDVGTVELNSASGDVGIDHAAAVTANVASGSVTAGDVDGRLSVRSASGDVRFAVAGSADITTASGDVTGVGAEGDLEVKTASGDASIDWVRGSTVGRTASGDLRVGAVWSGTVELDSASGDLSVGVATGSAAWLDVHSMSGDVSSALDQSGPPEDDAPVVSIHARSLTGDITIRRSTVYQEQS